MRIAQVAPLSEAVPPRLYGGTERVVSWLTEELVAMGHRVTLFASGDSETSADLVPCARTGLRLAGIRDHLASHLVMLETVRRRASEFDLIHFHVDLLPFPIFQDMAEKTVTTLHGRLDRPDFHPAYRYFPQMPLVSVSDSQREPMPDCVNWLATVHHGLPANQQRFRAEPGEYLAFLGRISPEKRPDRAIEIAKRAGLPLKIAAKIDHDDRAYFQEVIAPMLDHPLIEFIGEIDENGKDEFLARASALLFPIDWVEPFGLVMIEAMSAGTPVIGWPMGSVTEVITPGRSGFVVSSIEEAAAAVGAIGSLPRREVRAEFEERFAARRMAADYVAAYERLLTRTAPQATAPNLAPEGLAERLLPAAPLAAVAAAGA
ncbi:MAG: glycosyltransferase family 4 protein [Parvibaculaceae bacterium]